MNDLLERFFELESRQRMIAAGAALVLVFGAYWYFVCSGRRAETLSVTAKIADLREQRDSKQKLVANIAQLQETVRELGAVLKEAEAHFPIRRRSPIS
jgi:Tfp pilus assembly protein PilO